MYSQACVDLVKESEGLRLQAYFDSVGVRTIGWGRVTKNGPAIITEADAEQLLARDLVKAWDAVRRNVRVTLTQGQVDALTDFTLNLGEGNLMQ